MIKLLFGTLTVLFAFSGVNAQTAIQLQEDNTPLLPGVVHYLTVPAATFAVPSGNADQHWDYTKLKGDTAIKQTFILNRHNLFTVSPKSLEDTGQSEFLTSNSYMNIDNIYDEDINGVFLEGYYLKYQQFSLRNYFNDTADKIIVPEQNIYFRINQISLPMTAGYGQHIHAKKTVNFLWIVDTMGLKNDSSTKVTSYYLYDTVAGWGTFRMPSPTGPSQVYRALLVKKSGLTVDSYFVNHKAPNTIFLKAFGITQGLKTTSNQEYFYREGSANPLMVIDYGTDGSFTKPKHVIYSTDSIREQSGIEEATSLPGTFTIYPNPSAQRKVNCRFDKFTSAPWTLKVLDMTGRTVYAQQLSGFGHFDLPVAIQGNPGLYNIIITDENGNASAQVFSMIK